MIILTTQKTKFLSTDDLIVKVTVKNLTEDSLVDVTLRLPTGEQTKFSWNCEPKGEITKSIMLDAGLGKYALITNYCLHTLEVVMEHNTPNLSCTVADDIATLSSSGIYNESQWVLYIIPSEGTPDVKPWESPTKLDLGAYGAVTISLFNPVEKSATNIIKLAPVKKPYVPPKKVITTEVLFDTDLVEHGSIYWVTLRITNPLDTNVNVWFSPKLPKWLIPLFSLVLTDEPVKAKGHRDFKLGVRVETTEYKLMEETVQLSALDGYGVYDTTIIPLKCLETKVKVQPPAKAAKLSIEKLWFSASSVYVGDTVTLSLTIVNTGEIPIEEVKLHYTTLPEQVGNYNVGFSGLPLAPGDSYTYSAKMVAVKPGTLVYTIQEHSLQFESNGDMLSCDVVPSTTLTIS